MEMEVNRKPGAEDRSMNGGPGRERTRGQE
jgi:hypothetical protein